MEQSLENIKIGDIVIFSTNDGYQTIVGKVTRVTPKQLEVGSYKFRKKDGSMVGNNYNHCRFATEKDIADEMKKYRNSLRNTISQFFKSYQNINYLTIEELERIESIIKTKCKK